MFSGRPSVPPSVRACVRDSRGSFMFPRYLQYLLTDFRQTFVTGASWDTDDLITFFGSKGQSSRSHHRGGGAQHSTLQSSATFSSILLFISSLFSWFLVSYGRPCWLPISFERVLNLIIMSYKVCCKLLMMMILLMNISATRVSVQQKNRLHSR